MKPNIRLLTFKRFIILLLTGLSLLMGATTYAVPEIEVLDGMTNIVSGATAVNMGPTTVGVPVTQSFTVRNIGSLPLKLEPPVTVTDITGTRPFTVEAFEEPVTLAAGQSVTFKVVLNSLREGTFTEMLSLNSNDSDESPFNFFITGIVNASVNIPDIQVLLGTTEIIGGTTTPIDFGTTTVGVPISKSFIVKNLGQANLDLFGLDLPPGFSHIGVLPDSISPQRQTTFTVQLNTITEAHFTGKVKLFSNDGDENPFEFYLSGTVSGSSSSQEIQVMEGETDIIDGSESSVDFGMTSLGTEVSRTFIVKNTGNAPLLLTSEVSVTGQGFVVDSFASPMTLVAGGSTTFKIILEAAFEGRFVGMVSFESNDSDENTFDFPVSGVVSTVKAQEMACFEHQRGVFLGECSSADELASFNTKGLPTNTQMLGGVSKFDGFEYGAFKRSDTVTFNDSLIAAGGLKVDSQDVGSKADILVAALHTSEGYPNGFMWYMLVGCSDCPLGWTIAPLTYDETTAIPLLTKPEFLPLETVDKLPEYYPVNMYSGKFSFPGQLDIYFGYRLEEGDDKGKVIANTAPIRILITG